MSSRRIPCRAVPFVALALLIIGLGPSSQAQGRFDVRTLTEIDGLPHPSVLRLTRDDYGRIWARTGSGVSCYDGQSMISISHTELGSRNRQTCWLLPATKGRIWYLDDRADAGLLLLSAGKVERRIPLPFAPDERVLDAVVRTPASDGPIIASSQGELMYRKEGEWVRYRLRNGTPVHALTSFRSELWGLSEEGLLRIGPKSSELIATNPFPDRNSNFRWQLVGQELDGERRLWASNGRRLACYVRGAWRLAAADLGDVGEKGTPRVTVTPFRDGTIAVGMTQSLRLFDSRRMAWKPRDVASPWPPGSYDVLEDGSRVWVGNSRGLTLLKRQPFVDHPQAQELLAREVSAIHFLGDRLVLGHDTGVTFIDPKGRLRRLNFRVRAGERSGSVRVLDVADDGDGGMWLAANSLGLLHWSRSGQYRWLEGPASETQSVAGSYPPQLAMGVLADGPGAALVGSDTGLWRYRTDGSPPELLFAPVGETNSFCRRVGRDAEGRILVGTSTNGVFRETPSGYRPLARMNQEASNIYCFANLPDGRTLVGALDGLFVIEGDRLRKFREVRGLDIDLPVYALLADPTLGTFVGTRAGIIWIRENRFRHLTVEHGLAGQEVNRAALVRSPGGQLMVGTNGGLSVLDSIDFLPDEEPTVRIDDMRSTAGPLRVDDDLVRLPRGTTSLSFGLSTVSFGSRGQFRYRYRMHGLHDDWMEPKEALPPRLEFPRLDPGRYELVLQIRRPGGAWSESVMSPEFVIAAPWWTSPWFIAGTLLGFVGLGWFGRLFLSSRGMNRQLRRRLRERETELARRSLLYEAAFQRHSVAQLMIEPRSRQITDMNRAARDLLRISGFESEPLVLDDLVNLPAAELAERLQTCIEEKTLDRVHVLISKGDEPRTVEALLSPLTLGQRRRIQAVLLDVTDRHRLEEELRQAFKQLAVGRVTRGMAHDFNNLLQVIGGNSELALDRATDDETLREELEGILAASHRGRDLVRRLADLGRESPQTATPYRVDEALESSKNQISRALLHTPSIQFTLKSDVGEARLLGDPRALRAALVELVANARDAVNDDGHIAIEARRRDDGDGRARLIIDVIDDGPGFDPDILDRVTEPFFTTKDVGEGQGLGLAEVSRFATRSQGKLTIDNLRHGGACVRLEFSVRDYDVDLDLPTRPRSAGKYGILFVGSRGPQRAWIRDVLAERGYSAYEADDGPEALRTFSYLGHQIRVLVLGRDLGGLDPEDLARVLRSESEQLHVMGEDELEADLRSGAPELPAISSY